MNEKELQKQLQVKVKKKLEPLFNVGYTAEMEGELEKVEEGAVKGDGMLSAEYAALASFNEAAFRSTVLKVGHHGSSSSTSDATSGKPGWRRTNG